MQDYIVKICILIKIFKHQIHLHQKEDMMDFVY